jgi:hypothetical protein
MTDLDEEDKMKEKIRFKIELFRLSVLGLISLGGGTITIINKSTGGGRDAFFISTGYLLTVCLIIYARKTYNELKQLIA